MSAIGDFAKQKLTEEAAKRIDPYVTPQTYTEIKDTPDGPELKVTLRGGDDNLVRRFHKAYKTIDNDPGNHKKKALGALGLGTIGGVASLYAMFGNAKNNAAIRNSAKNAPGASSTVGTLASLAAPIAAYYALNNTDRPKRAIPAAMVSGYAAGEAMSATTKGMTQAEIDAAMASMPTSVKAAPYGLIGSLGLSMYSAHELQKAENLQRMQSLRDQDISDSDKAKIINCIRGEKDLYTRYPVLRSAPNAKKWADSYNKRYEKDVVPVVTKEDYDLYIRPKPGNREEVN